MTQRLPKSALWFACGNVFLRTIKREDASERWAAWLADPWTIAAVNPPRTTLGRKEIADYIRSFDQRAHLLLGIFERHSRRHVGVIRVDIDAELREAFVSALIGEAEVRNSGATTFAFEALLNHLFFTMKLARVSASVLERNRVTLGYLAKLGWTEQGEAVSTRANDTGEPLRAVRVGIDAEGYRAFRASPLGQRVLRRIADAARRAERR
ncbi:MAG: GNAT family N-acetyltransferase [Xanthobacteraceae bacterium]|nr:GNAT family N-acetyltransferase [Xanthobacteraceae bacterium]